METLIIQPHSRGTLHVADNPFIDMGNGNKIQCSLDLRHHYKRRQDGQPGFIQRIRRTDKEVIDLALSWAKLHEETPDQFD